MNLMLLPDIQEFEWLVGLLRNLRSLEHLGFGGGLDRTFRWLHHEIAFTPKR